jgi:hypothetical protein
MKSLLALLLLTVTASAQTSGQYLFQRVGTNGFVNQFITPQTGKYLKFQGGSLVLDTPTGNVTSVGVTVPTGFAVSGSPITTSGTIGVTYSSGYQGFTTAESTKLLSVVLGPPSATANAIPTFNGTTGKLIQNGTLTNPSANQLGGLSTITASGSGGILIESANGTDIGQFGAGNTANVTWYGNHNFNTVTANTIAGFGASKTLQSLATSTYPSLTELSYVKGVTSAIQTQIDQSRPLFCRLFANQSFASVSAFNTLDDFIVSVGTGVWQFTLHIEAVNGNGSGSMDYQLYKNGAVFTQLGMAITPGSWDTTTDNYSGWRASSDIVDTAFDTGGFDVGNFVHVTGVIQVTTAGLVGVRMRQTAGSTGAVACTVYADRTYMILTKLSDVTP